MNVRLEHREDLRFFWQVETRLCGVLLGLMIGVLMAIVHQAAEPEADIAPWLLWLTWANGMLARVLLGRPSPDESRT